MSNDNPSFSICIPNYNYGRFIGDTIESVLNQSYQNFEIIVADNASTDDSVAVVQRYQRQDARISLHRNRYNIGFAPNLQRVTQFAGNEFVNLLSSDDQMQPNALEEYARVIAEVDPDPARGLVLMSDAEAFDNNNKRTRFIHKPEGSFKRTRLPPDTPWPDAVSYSTFDGLEVLRDSLARLDAPGVFCSIVYSRSLWQAVEGYNGIRTIGPDTHFHYKLLSLNPLVTYVHAPLFRYRDYDSDNRAATKVTMRYPIDKYLTILEFGTPAFLAPLGLKEEELVHVYLDRICLRAALSYLGLGNYRFALQHFTFALSTFPAQTLKEKKTYLLLPLLALGPFSRLVASPLRSWYRRREQRTAKEMTATLDPARSDAYS